MRKKHFELSDIIKEMIDNFNEAICDLIILDAIAHGVALLFEGIKESENLKSH
jgi:hypothetical protein